MRSTDDEESLGSATFSALKWNYVGAATRAGSSLIVGIILARVLGPEPFGLVAIGWIVIGLGNLVADVGLGAALIQRLAIAKDEIRHVFTLQVLIGAVLTALLALAAPLIALFFRQEGVTPVVRFLSLAFLFQAWGVTSASLLKRDLKFKIIQSAQVVSYLVGFLGLGIPLAFAGAGVWSLVVAQLAQTLIASIIYYNCVRHSLRPCLHSSSKGLFAFGAKVLATNLVNYVTSNFDGAFIGRVFGTASLGLYNRSMTLMTTPMNSIVTSVQQVMFPAYSRAQGSLATLRRAYLTSVSTVALIILPSYVSIALIPDMLIRGLFGDRWIGAIPLVVPLALAMPFHAVMAMGGPMLWARNRVGIDLRIQILSAIALLIALVVCSHWSLLAVAWGVFGIYVLRCALVVNISLDACGGLWSELIASLRGPVFIAAIAGTVSTLLGHYSTFLPLTPFTRLLLCIATVALTSLVSLLSFPHLILTDPIRVQFSRLAAHLPSPFRTLARRLARPEVLSV